MLENMITAKVVVKPNGDKWDVAFARCVDDKIFPIANLGPCTGSEVYTKTGIKVPSPETPIEDRLEAAKEILRDRLANLPRSTVVSTASVQDAYLDALSLLGYSVEIELEEGLDEATDTE